MNTFDDIGAAQAQFDGRRLTVAREYRGARKIELARAVEVSPAAVTQWEQCRTRPTRAALAAVSLHLGFDPAFFAGDRDLAVLGESSTHFRSLRSTTKRQRLQLLAGLSLVAEAIALVEEHVALPTVSIPQLDVGDGLRAATDAAATVRQDWGFGAGPITNVVKLLETKGVVVTRPHLATTDVDAFSRWLNDRPVVVLASDKRDGARSRFDAAHELGHLVMHHDAEPGHHDVERQADAFAAEFLMPMAAIRQELPPRLNWPHYFELKGRWGASLAALIRRSRDLNVITQHAYERAQVQISARGWRREEPAPIPIELPLLLGRALELMQNHLHIDTSVLAEQLRLREDQLSTLWRDVIGSDETPARAVVQF